MMAGSMFTCSMMKTLTSSTYARVEIAMLRKVLALVSASLSLLRIITT